MNSTFYKQERVWFKEDNLEARLSLVGLSFLSQSKKAEHWGEKEWQK